MQRHTIVSRLFWWYVLAVLVSSVLPVQLSWGLLDASTGGDKWMHGLVYMLGAGVFYLWFRGRPRPSRRVYGPAFLWLVGLGAATELMQVPLPYRRGELTDFLADVLGGAAGMAILGLYGLLQRSRRARPVSRAVLLGLAVFALLAPRAGHGQGFQWWRVRDVRPGMKGIGYTTVQGDRPIAFQVEVLGLLPRVLPDMDLILARLSGGPLDRTGVFAGMSGSPVYIDGRLLGAVAYSWPFAREAIAGIVPFEAMKGYQERAARVSRGGAIRPARADLGAPEDLARGLLGDRTRLQRVLTAWTQTVERMFQPRAPQGAGLVPIPLAWVGHPVWRSLIPNLVPGSAAPAPVAAAASGPPDLRLLQPPAAPAAGPDLKPGMPIAVPLVRGDWSLTAFGTLTAVDGNRVYAFGHQLFNLGSLRLPLHRAQVVGVLSSLQSSFVMAREGPPLGVLDTDIWFTVSGLLGAPPPMTRIRLEMANEDQSQQFSYEIVRHPLLTPYLIQQITTANMVMSPLGQLFDGSIRVELTLDLQGLPDLTLRNVFSGLNPIGESTQFIAAVLLFLMNNPFQTVHIDQARLSIRQSRRSIQASLVEVRVLTQEVRAGERLPMVTSIHPRQDKPLTRKFALRLPEELAPGRYIVYVGGAALMNRFDAMFYYRYLHFKSLRDMLQLLRNLRQNDGLYVRLVRYNPTLMAEGQVYRNLPLQIYHQLRSRGTQGSHVVVPLEVVLARRFDWPYIIDGMQHFQIEIKPKAQTQETRPIQVSKEGP